MDNFDLIDRKALKEEFKRIYRCAETAEQLANNMEDAIDNAPTVSDRYDEGYSQGYIDGSTGADWKGGAE